MLKVTTVQMDVRLGDPDANLKTILEKTASVESDLVVFPECANSGYCFDDKEEAISFADTIPGVFTERLAEAAGQTGRWIAVGLLERNETDLYNTVVLVGPGGQLHARRKTHLPFIGVDRFVLPGDEILPIVTPFGVIGIVICYEWRFPEMARSLCLQGADVLLGLSNWPGGARAIPEQLIAARAVENHVWIVSSNRVGTERGVDFIGMSAIVDPTGKIVAQALNGVCTLEAEFDPSASRTKKIVRNPGEYEIDLFLDRRPSMYGSLVKE